MAAKIFRANGIDIEDDYVSDSRRSKGGRRARGNDVCY